MSKWSTRSGLYKVALGLTFFVFLVYALAFSTPAWVGRDPALSAAGANVDGKIFFQGLWVRCVGSDEIDFDDCDEQAFGDDWDWMDGVRGCWVGGMFFFLVGIIYSLIENCCGDEDSKDYGLTGTLVLLSGLCGSAGVIVVCVKMERSDSHGYDEYYWGYMLACIASGLAILLAIVLLIARNYGLSDSDSDDEDTKRRHGSRAIDYVNNYGKQSYGGGYGYGSSPYEYQNAGYRGDAGHYPQHMQSPTHHDGYVPPLGNGVSYHHQPAPASHPYTVYQGNSLPRQNNGGGGYYPSAAGGMRHSMAESADLSNGFTPTHIHAEHSMGGRGGGRGDYYMNGNRPY